MGVENMLLVCRAMNTLMRQNEAQIKHLTLFDFSVCYRKSSFS